MESVFLSQVKLDFIVNNVALISLCVGKKWLFWFLSVGSCIAENQMCHLRVGCLFTLTHNVCVSAVVRFRSRVLSHETKRRTKIKTYSLYVTAPLQKHFVDGWRLVHS
jgi:hypothetical protein